ncbi:MAG: glucose-6-phosphate dehydrogenase [Pseudolysinimonas sp.]
MSEPTLRPTIFVLFGATGDLAKRMVLPALYQLDVAGLLPDRWRLIGSGRDGFTADRFLAHVHRSIAMFGPPLRQTQWDRFAGRLRFASGDFTAGGHGALVAEIADARAELGSDSQLVHYLAVPPAAFGPLTISIGDHDLARGVRIVYEKPFGTSQSTFAQLDEIVHKVFDESQVYRIDHFLSKEATQDLHVVRFANGVFADMWGRHRVASVQIDCPETLGVADRAPFYDSTGAVLDMLATHLLQVAAEVAMEPPASLGPNDMITARESVIASFRPFDPADVVLGQYDTYQDLDGVRPGSRTETFVAATLWVDTPRWKGVPFHLRTGKRMHRTAQSVNLVLAPVDGPFAESPREANVLRFDLGGAGDIELTMSTKTPGIGLELDTFTTSLTPPDTDGTRDPLPPYVRLLHDVLAGDRSLVTRPDGLADAWEVVQPILDLRRRPLPYAPGSWGPHAADRLVAPSRWLTRD